MPRFRRYRLFVACAVFVLFLLYRVSINTDWDDGLESQFKYVAAVLPNPGRRPVQPELAQKPRIPHAPAEGNGIGDDDRVKIPELKSNADAGANYALPPPTPAGQHVAAGRNGAPPLSHPPAAGVPDRKPGKVQDVYANGVQNSLHAVNPPGRYEPSPTFTPPIHWTKLPERFPVEEGSLIPLPTGKPKTIPTIQHKFAPETESARKKREERLDEIRTEAKRVWDGYRNFAFGHDELVPMSNASRDPFCGWAATLVDSLDTLWIMGLKTQFQEAYSGLKHIDFTTANRDEIPVFETTIRYLGGLLSAYDVTGGHKGEYPMLLSKAVELAEVLMGVFDTPNRMPILFYKWKPAYASQPKRASTRSGIAELGTLSMEFTRLAQLTGKDKYYDAVARITDALEEWQNRDDETASLIPGIFPENIDASGCNRSVDLSHSVGSANSQPQQQTQYAVPHEPEGYTPQRPPSAEMELRDTIPGGAGSPKKLSPRSMDAPTPPKIGPAAGHWSAAYKGGSSSRSPVNEPLAADGLPVDWECAPMNLTATSGYQSYGMGGSQDSAYEYFPKQYLLLGGLEAKYRSMHEKTVAAVKEHLLYRPMTIDNADILFSAKIRARPGDFSDLGTKPLRDYEVTHLTCFLGGMFAMGAKIFDSDEDLEVGRRLTDGCVWAYDSMPSGIMAEFAQVTPCQDADACQWNETEWHLALDPNPKMREDQMEFYKTNLEEWEVAKQKALRAEAVMQQAAEELGIQTTRAGETQPDPGAAQAGVPKAYVGASRNRGGPAEREDDVQDRTVRNKRDLDPAPGDTPAFDPMQLDQKAIEEKIKKLEAEYFPEAVEATTVSAPPGSFGGVAGQVPIEATEAKPSKPKPKPPFKIPPKPHKPMTHLEFVESRINNSALPPGYTQIGSSGYQLRPEAIESVWYMYRITGDPVWQEKGWKMWLSIIKHVRVPTAHSAIQGVHDLKSLKPTDSMESFWLAETLKYFYLLFSEPDVISLDDWVLNTEAHPFRRPS